jgi:hypothetical protein
VIIERLSKIYHYTHEPVSFADAKRDNLEVVVVVVEEEFFNHCKNDLKGHAHTPSGDAGADLWSQAGGGGAGGGGVL